ncbi:MAG: GDSL-type esterase/lipase family protein [Chthoniobacterales bacterium]
MRTRRVFVVTGVMLFVVAGFVVRSRYGDAPLDRSPSARPDGNDAVVGRTPQIVFLGDSRIEWGAWPELLKRADILNRGIAGDTTSGILQRLRAAVPNDGGMCLIQAGVNDLSQGFAPEKVVANFGSILDYLRAEKRAHVIITSVILVGQERSDLNGVINDCNRRLAQLAAARGARWLDLDAVLSARGYLAREYSEDGVHLNAEGYEQLCGALAPLLPAEAVD